MTELRDQLQGTLGAAYALERELGGGGMSRVFVATETALGRTVVVKVMPPDLVGDVNIDRFRREVRLAARLQHPNIVPLLAAGEMAGVPYYTMPFVDGQSLRERLRETGALPISETISILRDIARALAYAHAQGVVHRDVKPDNVLLSGGVAVVTDFGIAKALSESSVVTGRISLTMRGTSIGTPAYMPPEQAAADPGIDHRADLYAFGCLAYELLTGQPPFADLSPSKRLQAQISEVPAPVSDFRPDVPRALEALVAKCLQAHPDDRPQRAEEIVAAFDAVVARRTAQVEMAVPTRLLVPVMLGKALMLYMAVALVVLMVVRGMMAWLGLPSWALPAAAVALAIGAPYVLWSAWTHYRARRAASDAPAAPNAPAPNADRGHR